MPGRSPSLAGPLKGLQFWGGWFWGSESAPCGTPCKCVEWVSSQLLCRPDGWPWLSDATRRCLLHGASGSSSPHSAHCPHSLPSPSSQPGCGKGLGSMATLMLFQEGTPPAPDGCASLGWGGSNLIPSTPTSPPSCLCQLRPRDQGLQGSSRCSEPRALSDSGR